jgi:hypothetical protein
MDENPVFYEKLSVQLQVIIDQMRQHLVDAAAAVKELWKLQHEALSVADMAAQQGLSQVSFAVYELLEREASDRTEPPTAEQQNAPAPHNRDLDQQLKSMALIIEQTPCCSSTAIDSLRSRCATSVRAQRRIQAIATRSSRPLGPALAPRRRSIACSTLGMRWLTNRG